MAYEILQRSEPLTLPIIPIIKILSSVFLTFFIFLLEKEHLYGWGAPLGGVKWPQQSIYYYIIILYYFLQEKKKTISSLLFILLITFNFVAWLAASFFVACFIIISCNCVSVFCKNFLVAVNSIEDSCCCYCIANSNHCYIC